MSNTQFEYNENCYILFELIKKPLDQNIQIGGLTALQWLKVLPFIKCTFRELIYGGSKNSCILEAAAAEGWKRSSEK